MITFTLDLEDHRSDMKYEKRYPDITREVLALLNGFSIKGTFFVVGTVAEADKGLIKEIAESGHEIAFHSYDHIQLNYEKNNKFYNETKKGKELLEDIVGEEVIGYRAPVFSLTKETLWVLDVLNELGFKYSSSILPASNPLNGFPDAPKLPFFWPNGLLEIPVPVIQIGTAFLPYLGGVYLRYIPLFILKYLVLNNKHQHQWIYCHPYDFDPNEPFFRIKGASNIVSLILWFNRRGTEKKISALLKLNSECTKNHTFREQYISGVFSNSPLFNI